MARNKRELYDELFRICEEDTVEQVIKYIFDYSDTRELAGLVEHIKEEKGINVTLNNDDE